MQASTIQDAETRLKALIDAAQAGEHVYISNFASAATVWEIGIKRALGKLDAPQNLVGVIEEEGFALLSITPMHAETAAALPPHHRDPFDRMLIA